MMDYQELKGNFSWKEAEHFFNWQPGASINMAYLTCDRWATESDRIAIYWEDEAGNQQTWTYLQLMEQSNRLANGLQSMGIKKGDRVAGLLGKDMELIIAILATWKVGAIYVPLFTAFETDAIMHRLNDSGAHLVITNKQQVEKIADKAATVQILLSDGLTNEGQTFWQFVESFSTEHKMQPTLETDPAVIQYTSGTTGLPKGAVLTHKGIISLYPYTKFALNLENDDIFFGGADLGWAYGLMACTFSPLSFGIPIVAYSGQFQVEKIYELLDKYAVTNFTYAPTAYRMMKAAGKDLLKQYNLKVSKFSSAGEPLNGEVVRFFEKHFGRGIYDQYGSTETGMIVNNYNIIDMCVKPGSMGFPIPGFKVELIDYQGNPVKQGETGQIAVDSTNDFFQFQTYWKNPQKAADKKLGRWFITGDLAKMDEDGYYWFQGRADDVISSAGYRIGPTEVEDSLMSHPAVVETAVVGKPDETKGEIVKAFVVLNKGYNPSDELAEELSQYVKKKLSKHQYPREVEFLPELPKTQSGKIQRYMLRKMHVEQ
ncbi:AMP-binding protein [Lentibacillus sp. L22]|uniref:acyl-CoA synthetase n=1 Tax=Lentibacillus sp. L22 TaxID=3163028 RepID=UPI003465C89E